MIDKSEMKNMAQAMMKIKSVPDDLTCTQMQQTWHKPRPSQIEAEPVMNVSFRRASQSQSNPKRDPIICTLFEARASCTWAQSTSNIVWRVTGQCYVHTMHGIISFLAAVAACSHPYLALLTAKPDMFTRDVRLHEVLVSSLKSRVVDVRVGVTYSPAFRMIKLFPRGL